MNLEPKQLLSELLAELFSPEELKAFLAQVPACQLMLRDLPEPTFRHEVFFTAVSTALIRHKATDDTFFQLMEEERPNWGQEIEEVKDALLNAPSRGGSVARLGERPRFMSSFRRVREQARDKSKVLFLAASSSEAARTLLEREVQEVSRRLRSSTFHNRIELKPIIGVSFQRLPAILEKECPRVVHFTGNSEMFEGVGDDSTDIPSGEALSELLGAQEGVCLVVLNSCCSPGLARDLAQRVDLVVGLQPVDSALVQMAFAGSFYQMLAEGADVRYAFESACEVVMTDDGDGRSREPILVQRTGVNAEEIFLVEE